MIIVTRINMNNQKIKTGIPLNWVGLSNEDEQGNVWLEYSNGVHTKKMKVAESLEEIQVKMFAMKHGKKPATGILSKVATM